MKSGLDAMPLFLLDHLLIVDNFFLYIQKDYSGDYQLQCYGMNADNSWTSGGESGYCAVYPELYEGARQAIRFCPCH